MLWQKLKWWKLVLLFVLASCAFYQKNAFVVSNSKVIDQDVLSRLPTRLLTYHKDVKPIFDKRCVVCHGCYDAPCQLKLTSYDEVMRGANKEVVYDGTRIMSMSPTRSFIDGKSTEDWRKMNFFPVIAEEDKKEVQDRLKNSSLYQIIKLKELNPQPRMGLLSSDIDTGLDRKQFCPTSREFDQFSRKHSSWGMPFAFPNLTNNEFSKISHWVAQGSIEGVKKKRANNLQEINKWEDFLNGTSLKEKLVSRYIYEHIFSAHIHFRGDLKDSFYRLVRSKTPRGTPIDEIATIRPYEDPKSEFYYRFKEFPATIVAKDHNYYELSDEKMKRYKELFYETQYVVNEVKSYHPKEASNPFKTFYQIPVKSRYKFLLDNSRFFIEGFIKGPVCRGQVALNVIEDRFWVYFINPEKDVFLNQDEFVKSNKNFLQLPADRQSHFELLSIWTDYWKNQRRYLESKGKQLTKLEAMKLDEALDFIWDGKGVNPNAALTVFRHLDSASVRFGSIGKVPETAWIIDYPLLERIHYLLVAGFNVYGNVGHQLATRLYMDFLRMEGENNFLSFLPVDKRKDVHESWYGGNRNHTKTFIWAPKDWLEAKTVTSYNNSLPTLFKKIKRKAFVPTKMNSIEIPFHLKRLESLRGIKLSHFPETIFLKVGDDFYTIVHNKEYKHVSYFLSDGKNRDVLDKENDTLTVVAGAEGSYPNLFLEVKKDQLSSFVDELSLVENKLDFQSIVGRYGIRRTNPRFWHYSDWFHKKFKEQMPLRYGVLDLNRYLAH